VSGLVHIRRSETTVEAVMLNHHGLTTECKTLPTKQSLDMKQITAHILHRVY